MEYLHGTEKNEIQHLPTANSLLGRNAQFIIRKTLTTLLGQDR